MSSSNVLRRASARLVVELDEVVLGAVGHGGHGGERALLHQLLAALQQAQQRRDQRVQVPRQQLLYPTRGLVRWGRSRSLGSRN